MGEFDFNAPSQGCSLAAPGLLWGFPAETLAKLFGYCNQIIEYRTFLYALFLSLWFGLWWGLNPLLLLGFRHAFLMPRSHKTELSHHMVAYGCWSDWFCRHRCRYRLISSRLVPIDRRWRRGFPGSIAMHRPARKCCTHYCGAFVCRGTLQLLCGGGDMVEAILMQCPPLPDSRRSSSSQSIAIAAGTGC